MYNMYILYILYMFCIALEGTGCPDSAVLSERENEMYDQTKGVAEVRSKFSEFLDNAAYGPEYIRRKRDVFAVVPSSLLEFAIPYVFAISFGYDTTKAGRIYFTKNNLIPDIIGFGDTKEKAIDSFVAEVENLCQDYRNNPQLYMIAPNRKKQVPAIIKASTILARGGDIREMIEAGDV